MGMGGRRGFWLMRWRVWMRGKGDLLVGGRGMRIIFTLYSLPISHPDAIHSAYTTLSLTDSGCTMARSYQCEQGQGYTPNPSATTMRHLHHSFSFLCHLSYLPSRQNLEACPLVSRTWRPIAQSLFFQYATLTTTFDPRSWFYALSHLVEFLEIFPGTISCKSSFSIQGSKLERASANLVPATSMYSGLSLLLPVENLALRRIVVYVSPTNQT